MSEELTREVLRAELRAARAEDRLELRRELDERLEPVTAHINRIEAGQLTPAMSEAVLTVVEKGAVGAARARWVSRSTRAAVAATCVSCLSFLVSASYAAFQIFT
jgi:hypothetical protein